MSEPINGIVIHGIFHMAVEPSLEEKKKKEWCYECSLCHTGVPCSFTCVESPFRIDVNCRAKFIVAGKVKSNCNKECNGIVLKGIFYETEEFNESEKQKERCQFCALSRIENFPCRSICARDLYNHFVSGNYWRWAKFVDKGLLREKMIQITD